MFYFATYFDRNYLSRGLVLYESLKANCSRFDLYILCLDEFTSHFFQKNADRFPEIKLILIEELEANDDELRACKSNRSQIEYYFTLSPCLPLYILKKYNVPHVCSLDADIMFFNSVEPIFQLLSQYSILITPHKFSARLLNEQRLKYGIYNVSFQVFKNNKAGLTCLEKWRNDCIDWCYDFYDDTNGGRFADQKYLDTWHNDYPGEVAFLDMPNAGLAVWNIDNYTYNLKNNIVYVDNEPLVFYHFHHFKVLSDNMALNGFNDYKVSTSSGIIRSKIYLPYWNNLSKFNDTLQQQSDFSIRRNSNTNKWIQVFKSGTVFIRLNNRNFNFSLVLFRDSIFVVKKIYGLFSRS
jgi:hypothetical protein